MAMALRGSPRQGALDPTEALSSARTAGWRWVIGSPAVDWSPRASDVLGIPEIVLRSPELLLEAVHPGDLALAANAFDAWRKGQPVSAQVRLDVAGERRWFEISGRVLPGTRTEPEYATGTLRDVTEDREALDALVEALREAEALLNQIGTHDGPGFTWARGRVA